jgi:hypothetical protein
MDRTIKASDLTGELVLDETQLAVLTVLKHPALVNGPVKLETALSELKSVDKNALDVAIFDLTMGGETKRVVMQLAAFNALARNGDMDHVVANAASVKQPAMKVTATDRIDYTTPDRYGQLHRGKITDEEARLVRENPDQASANRKAQGHPPIDWDDPKEQARYGLKTESAFS